MSASLNVVITVTTPRQVDTGLVQQNGPASAAAYPCQAPLEQFHQAGNGVVPET